MAPKKRMTAKKRMFGDLENEGTSRDSQAFHLQNANIETVANLQNRENMSVEGLEEFDGEMRNDRVMAKKNVSRRRDFFEHFQNEGTSVDVDNGIQKSLSFGQASYQKSKQGTIIEYKDIGDNVFQCIHCNAHFWLDEANKRNSRNAPIIYTSCCQEGQVKLKQSNPTPQFLEQLLDPKNGRESVLFRENIRVYNSMFSFTSMGAKIDYSINDGSGPYVFKICGQVHHLMGSILPSDGEFPKYAQLYVYDTHNEISNRINAIDPSHVNQKMSI